ncbi:hypothetical protein KP509_17G024600 [Ceratopteris richardii]|uniref:Uncharacterized protein n=1 Tax=Ceratopteris richardii TaxID=49495 RepID=A0A8T2SST9_CERRI|nr:hypothetical protein KP509_17G024600 [Ceratopteris richardii]
MTMMTQTACNAVFARRTPVPHPSLHYQTPCTHSDEHPRLPTSISDDSVPPSSSSSSRLSVTDALDNGATLSCSLAGLSKTLTAKDVDFLRVYHLQQMAEVRVQNGRRPFAKHCSSRVPQLPNAGPSTCSIANPSSSQQKYQDEKNKVQGKSTSDVVPQIETTTSGDHHRLLSPPSTTIQSNGSIPAHVSISGKTLD